MDGIETRKQIEVDLKFLVNQTYPRKRKYKPGKYAMRFFPAKRNERFFSRKFARNEERKIQKRVAKQSNMCLAVCQSMCFITLL